MVLNLIVVAFVAGTLWWWARRDTRQVRHARDDRVTLLPYEDLPPIGAFAPLPAAHEMDDYIADGMDRISGFLAGRDQAA